MTSMRHTVGLRLKSAFPLSRTMRVVHLHDTRTVYNTQRYELFQHKGEFAGHIEHFEGCSRITSLHVNPDHRHVGVGSSMVRLLAHRLRMQGHAFICVRASRSSGGFYEKVGLWQIPSNPFLRSVVSTLLGQQNVSHFGFTFLVEHEVNLQKGCCW